MSDKTHWLQSPDKNYLGHWDIPEGGDLVVTIKTAEWKEVENPINRTKDFKRVITFHEKSIKPWICNQTNAESILKATGVRYMEDSDGQRISLYVKKVKAFGDWMYAIRVRDTKPELPELTPDHKSWLNAKKAIAAGNYTVEQIKGKYKLSPENEKLLCSK